eukprot:TRINITY_DN21558_c0_g1_i1.p1 TRINITY_DN21558_c0_g1~~TRINITY_DN21558_c0_g1_i1.p1  ORF type:complete len:642 (-),score=81.74 TRINITY_DN21558_c0_g1_i1:130-2055(-)
MAALWSSSESSCLAEVHHQPHDANRVVCCFGLWLLTQNLLLLNFVPEPWECAFNVDQGSWGAENRRDPWAQRPDAMAVRDVEITSKQLSTAPAATKPPLVSAPYSSVLPSPSPSPKPTLPAKQNVLPRVPPLAPVPRPQHADMPVVVETGTPLLNGGVRQKNHDSSISSVNRSDLRLFGPIHGDRMPAFCFGIVAKFLRDVSAARHEVHRLLQQVEFNDVSAERKTVVVVLLSGGDEVWEQEMSNTLRNNHRNTVSDGRLHVIRVPSGLLPRISVCPPLCPLRMSNEKVAEFAQENLDHAFLMYYSAPLAEYYLQLSQAASFVPVPVPGGWMGKLFSYEAFAKKDYLSKESNAPWRAIDLSGPSTCVGKLMQSTELVRLAQHFLLFYDQSPCYTLLQRWIRAMTQSKFFDFYKTHGNGGVIRDGAPQSARIAQPGVGNSQQDNQHALAFSGYNNPKGVLIENLTVVDTYLPKYLYLPGGEPQTRADVCNQKLSPWIRPSRSSSLRQCWLWAKDVRAGQHVTLIFTTGVRIKRILAEFGVPRKEKDVLEHGELQIAGDSGLAMADQPRPRDQSDQDWLSSQLRPCAAFAAVAKVDSSRVVEWVQGSSPVNELLDPITRCVRIKVLQDQVAWVIMLRLLIEGS